jgi:hypothetical protein
MERAEEDRSRVGGERRRRRRFEDIRERGLHLDE